MGCSGGALGGIRTPNLLIRRRGWAILRGGQGPLSRSGTGVRQLCLASQVRAVAARAAVKRRGREIVANTSVTQCEGELGCTLKPHTEAAASWCEAGPRDGNIEPLE